MNPASWQHNGVVIVKSEPKLALALAEKILDVVKDSGANRYEIEVALKTTQELITLIDLRDKNYIGRINRVSFSESRFPEP